MGFGTPRDDKPVVVDVPARVVTLSKATGSPDIRIFDVAAVNEAINRQVAAMKPEESTVAVAYVDRDGANVAIVGKIKRLPGEAAWTVFATTKWNGDWNAGAAFRWAV